MTRQSTVGWSARGGSRDLCPVLPGSGYLDGPRRPEKIVDRNRRVLLDAIGLPNDQLHDDDRDVVEVLAAGFSPDEVNRLASVITHALVWAAEVGGHGG